MNQSSAYCTKLLLSYKDLVELGLSRTAAYRLLSREDLPVVIIGGRRFMNGPKFLAWIDKNGDQHSTESEE